MEIGVQLNHCDNKYVAGDNLEGTVTIKNPTEQPVRGESLNLISVIAH